MNILNSAGTKRGYGLKRRSRGSKRGPATPLPLLALDYEFKAVLNEKLHKIFRPASTLKTPMIKSTILSPTSSTQRMFDILKATHPPGAAGARASRHSSRRRTSRRRSRRRSQSRSSRRRSRRRCHHRRIHHKSNPKRNPNPSQKSKSTTRIESGARELEAQPFVTAKRKQLMGILLAVRQRR